MSFFSKSAAPLSGRSFRPLAPNSAKALLVPFTAVAAVSLVIASSIGQSTTDSPVKVHGGSMTFFTQNGVWTPLPGAKKKTYCSAIRSGDQNKISQSGFFSSTSFAPGTPPSGTIQVRRDNWSIKLLTQEASNTVAADTPSPATGIRAFRVAQEGILLTSSTRDCKDGNSGPSIRISPLGPNSDFYSKDLLPHPPYKSNKRFRSNCTGEDTDTCERVAELQVFDGDATQPGASLKQKLDCPDGACVLYVGQLQIHADPTKKPVRQTPGAQKP